MTNGSRRFSAGTLVLVGLASLVVGAIVGGVLQPLADDDGGYIRLSSGNGTCSVQESGGILEKSSFVYVGKGRKKVRWLVFNDCASGGAVKVTVTNFQETPDAVRCDSSDTVVEGERSVSVGPGRRGRITLELRDAPKQIYYYSVCADGVAVSDPILRIER